MNCLQGEEGLALPLYATTPILPSRPARGRPVLASALKRCPDGCAAACPSVPGKPAQTQLETYVNQSENPTNDGTKPVDTFNSTSSPSLREYYAKRLEHVRQHLPEAARQLKEIGIVRVEVYYDGCGDSGQIESLHYFDAGCKQIDVTGRVKLTHDALKDLFYDLIEVRHDGWENNDGAFGQFVWELTTDTLSHSHSERYAEYDTTDHEGL
jgi:hypothetical protein